MKALAVDFGGSHATCGLVEDDRLIALEKIDVGDAHSVNSVLPQVAESFRRLLGENAVSAETCAGVAMGLPSIVDARTGAVLDSRAKYEDSVGFDLAAWSREQFGLALRAENDARMALLGERYAGAAQGFSNVIMMTLGTGIGGTAMIEGKLLRGKHAQAGCLGGHLPVLFTGRRCMCGAIGCAEAEGSSWALPLVARDWPAISTSRLAPVSDRLNFEELFHAAELGDTVEILVMGGGVLKREATIVPFVQKYLDHHAWTEWGKVQVKPAQLGNNAALLGAVPLLTERFE